MPHTASSTHPALFLFQNPPNFRSGGGGEHNTMETSLLQPPQSQIYDFSLLMEAEGMICALLFLLS